MMLLLLALACYPVTPEDTSDDPVAGDTCTVLTTGRWTVTGAAWNMADNPMDGDLSFNAESCTFTLGNWDMQMDDLPSGGVVDDAAVQLTGANSEWDTCAGTAASETEVSGTCAADGDDFQMVLSTE